MNYNRRKPEDNDQALVELLHDHRLPAELKQDLEAAFGYIESARSPATLAAYDSDWDLFCGWYQERFGALPRMPVKPGEIALFLAAQAQSGISPPTLVRRAAAIRHKHVNEGYENPSKTNEKISTYVN